MAGALALLLTVAAALAFMRDKFVLGLKPGVPHPVDVLHVIR